MINLKTNNLVKVIPDVPGIDGPVARRTYANLQDQNLLAVIDPTTETVVARYPVGHYQHNHGMALGPLTIARSSFARETT